ncbi:hypothetical protein [Adhaeribacter terreus]|uniref:Uncharacterized protein n=1 Tax=Adhaeribacter terreus TaxID=529703 RepID=A0ABW0E8M6_9BACT
MKILRSVILLSLLLLSFTVQSQIETVANRKKKLQQLYLGFGAGPALTFAPDLEKHGLMLFSHLNLSFNETTFFRCGLNYTPYFDNLSRYKNLGRFDNQKPLHELHCYYLSVGKRKKT